MAKSETLVITMKVTFIVVTFIVVAKFSDFAIKLHLIGNIYKLAH